ncbi:hypothetical protein C8Q80DRAFT_143126 [Daedaleopsis nitida]|nr:hypothetical protein C8Q80DRAFT_143126 [Daedaleopsis nitida]
MLRVHKRQRSVLVHLDPARVAHRTLSRRYFPRPLGAWSFPYPNMWRPLSLAVTWIRRGASMSTFTCLSHGQCSAIRDSAIAKSSVESVEPSAIARSTRVRSLSRSGAHAALQFSLTRVCDFVQPSARGTLFPRARVCARGADEDTGSRRAITPLALVVFSSFTSSSMENFLCPENNHLSSVVVSPDVSLVDLENAWHRATH